MNTNLSIAALILTLLGACQAKKDATDRESEIKIEQYSNNGRALYNQSCSACHGTSGEGLAQLMPPLKSSDYLEANKEKVPCIIKNGLSGEITVNGVVFNQPMAGMPHLTALQIAEILTYVNTEFNQQKKLVSVKEVEASLLKCE